MSIYNSLKQALGITEAQIVADGLLAQMCLYDCIVVINDYPNNSDYLRYLAEIKQLLKADGVVIDPAVFKNHKGIVCSRTFAWLRIPNPSPIETSILQYENLLLVSLDEMISFLEKLKTSLCQLLEVNSKIDNTGL